MSLTDHIKTHQLEPVTEDNFFINEIPKFRKINLIVWIDKFASRGVNHAARVKIKDSKTNVEVVINPADFSPIIPRTMKELKSWNFDHKSLTNVVLPILKRRAVHDAIVYMCMRSSCPLEPEHLVDALYVIGNNWDGTIPSNYDDETMYKSDLAIITKFAKSDGIDYVPIHKEELVGTKIV